ncbi:MAG: enolase, partial [Candidatus Micrarchaeia archaeon]
GVKEARRNVYKMAKYIIGRDLSQRQVDSILIKLAGKNKSKMGANATVALSMAFCAASANEVGVPIYEYLNKNACILPIPLMNIINGGQHAGNELAIQEFMIIPIKFKRFSEALRAGCEIYYILKNIVIERYGKSAKNVGDEGGFAPPMKVTTEALDCIMSAINKAGYMDKVFIGIDCASSNFFDGKKYNIDCKVMESDQLLEYYAGLVKDYPIISIEDPFHEKDWKAFAKATRELDTQIVGDDILVSNIKYLKRGIKEKAGNAILLKVNQVGTLIEAINTANYAKKNDWNVIVSHRSGETEDTFIADLAVALETGQIKTGAPCRGERTAKYNQLLRIEESLGKKARYGCRLGKRL